MPGETDTEFLELADLMNTKIGTQRNKADPAAVARIGFEAMMKGESDVVAGLKNKLQTAMASITPAEVLAELSIARWLNRARQRTDGNL
jgi:short-subunit dehydrogenase